MDGKKNSRTGMDSRPAVAEDRCAANGSGTAEPSDFIIDKNRVRRRAVHKRKLEQ